MTEYTRRYNRFKGYTLKDCACEYCLHFAGRKKPCPLEVCCCADEKRQAIEHERAGTQLSAVSPCPV